MSFGDTRTVRNDRVPSHVDDAAASVGIEPGDPTWGFRREETSSEVDGTG